MWKYPWSFCIGVIFYVILYLYSPHRVENFIRLVDVFENESTSVLGGGVYDVENCIESMRNGEKFLKASPLASSLRTADDVCIIPDELRKNSTLLSLKFGVCSFPPRISILVFLAERYEFYLSPNFSPPYFSSVTSCSFGCYVRMLQR